MLLVAKHIWEYCIFSLPTKDPGSESGNARDVSISSSNDIQSLADTSPTISSTSELTITNSEDDREDEIDILSKLSPHERFYLPDGNLLIICEETVFRVHTGLLTLNSRILREKLAPLKLIEAEQYEGCPCIYLPDKSHEFYVLLMVIYHPG